MRYTQPGKLYWFTADESPFFVDQQIRRLIRSQWNPIMKSNKSGNMATTKGECRIIALSIPPQDLRSKIFHRTFGSRGVVFKWISWPNFRSGYLVLNTKVIELLKGHRLVPISSKFLGNKVEFQQFKSNEKVVSFKFAAIFRLFSIS